jgi:hypothetical protein
MSVVRRITDHAVQRRRLQRRLRQPPVDLERVVDPLEVLGADLDLGLPARQIVVRRMRAPLGHQLVAAGVLDRPRHLRLRIVDVAEEPRVRRARHHARRLAVRGW